MSGEMESLVLWNVGGGEIEGRMETAEGLRRTEGRTAKNVKLSLSRLGGCLSLSPTSQFHFLHSVHCEILSMQANVNDRLEKRERKGVGNEKLREK